MPTVCVFYGIHYVVTFISENEINIAEVDKLPAINDVTTFQVDGLNCGVTICYDTNFDEFVKHE